MRPPVGTDGVRWGQPVTAYVNEKGEAKFDPITTDTLTIGFGATVPKRTLSRNGDPSVRCLSVSPSWR